MGWSRTGPRPPAPRRECYSHLGPFAQEVEVVKDLKLRQAGGSVSATLPKEMADRLHLAAGDRVLAVETNDGILLTPYDPQTEWALAIAAQTARKYRNALRELAK